MKSGPNVDDAADKGSYGTGAGGDEPLAGAGVPFGREIGH